LHYSEFDSVAIAYDEIKKAKLTGKRVSSRKEIFDGINQLVKFICYETHQSFKRVRDLGRLAKNENKIIMLLFPIIVFDGNIFEVSLISGEPQIQKKHHLLLQTHFQCPYCHKVESYIIDIVHRQYFEKFLDIFKRYMTETHQILAKNSKGLVHLAKKDIRKSELERRTQAFFGRALP
jgi:hypothetical protein